MKLTIYHGKQKPFKAVEKTKSICCPLLSSIQHGIAMPQTGRQLMHCSD